MQNLKMKQTSETFARAANDNRYGISAGVGLGSMVVAGLSQAAVDTAGITAGVADAATAVGVIGAAVVLVVLGIKVYKWIARSL